MPLTFSLYIPALLNLEIPGLSDKGCVLWKFLPGLYKSENSPDTHITTSHSSRLSLFVSSRYTALIMAFLTNAVSFILVVVLCIQHINAQTVPDRCQCPNTSQKAYKWKTIEEFSITAPRSRCKDKEIILILKTSTDKKTKDRRCISPNIYQAVQLQECWESMNKDGKRFSVKAAECEYLRNGKKDMKNTTTVRQP